MNLDSAIWDVLLRLPLAALLGALIGWERETEGKPAGLRTNMMVALGASTFTLLATNLAAFENGADPTRIVTGVATGIGFLGAGSIIQSSRGVEGMTTAAGIWVVGAIGAACGLGAYSIAIVTAVLAFVILALLLRLEIKANPNGKKQQTGRAAGRLSENSSPSNDARRRRTPVSADP